MQQFTLNVPRLKRAVCFVVGVGCLLAATLISYPQQNTPGCPEWTEWFGTWQNGQNVILNTDNLNATYKAQVENARGEWNSALANKGVGVGFVNPPASSAHGAVVTFELGDVIDKNGQRQVSVIQSTTYDANGYLTGAVIRLDPNKQLTNSQGQVVNALSDPSNILRAVLHELGHTLGLGHHPFDPTKPCGGQTTPSVMNTMCSASPTNMPTSLTDCDKAGAKESYLPTTTPTPTPGDVEYNPCGWLYGTYYDCDSPLLRDYHGNGTPLTSPNDGVNFDLDADGKKERRAWTVAGDDCDAWIGHDQNGNGKIDNGLELFGTAGGYRNGFDKLKLLFDTNHDNRIDPLDARYNSLLEWRDVNHNGESEADELDPLTKPIPLDYHESRHRDRHGNWFRYKSGDFTDVWLTRQ